MLATGAFGGLIFGPLGHVWYACLDKLASGLGAPGTLTFLLVKVLAENVLFTPLYVGLFMAYNSLLVSRSGPAGTLTKLQQDFLPTVAAEGIIWPPIMAVLFACVPLSHQVRGIDAGCACLCSTACMHGQLALGSGIGMQANYGGLLQVTPAADVPCFFHLQLLAVNAVTVADVAFLSWLETHDVSELVSALSFTP